MLCWLYLGRWLAASTECAPSAPRSDTEPEKVRKDSLALGRSEEDDRKGRPKFCPNLSKVVDISPRTAASCHDIF